MSSTICESFSASLCKTAVYPIITMIKILRTQMMVWFKERRDVSKQCCSVCTPNTEKLLVGILKEASDLKTLAADGYIYQVNDKRGLTFTVDLRVRTCTCKVFQSLKIPCIHALSAIATRKDDIYSFVDNQYSNHSWGKIYAEVIMPILSPLQFVTDDGTDLFPKKTSLPSSEPGETRRESSREGFKVNVKLRDFWFLRLYSAGCVNEMVWITGEGWKVHEMRAVFEDWAQQENMKDSHLKPSFDVVC